MISNDSYHVESNEIIFKNKKKCVVEVNNKYKHEYMNEENF